MSHKSVWCLLRDIESLLHGSSAFMTVVHHGKTPSYQSCALHYLCHPSQLEDCDAYDFLSHYQVVRVTSQNQDSLLYFDNSNFSHPSFKLQKQSFMQGVKKVMAECLIKVFEYEFPNMAKFGGSMLDPDLLINESREKYLKLVLLLFHLYRKLDDIVSANSYTWKLHAAVQDGTIGDKAKNFLQNLQDCRSNCMHTCQVKDDLEKETVAFQPADLAFNELDKDDEEEDNNLEG